ncbi:MAG: PAS domain S-box protein [Negativicutes bacterium]|nr:PAS domain S-box protein [Negativicutes bacterium]
MEVQGEKTENEAAVVEAHYRGLFDKLSDAFAYRRVITDKAGRPVDLEFVSVNPAFETQFGVTAGEIIGKRYTEVFQGCDRNCLRWIDTVGTVAITGESAAFEQFLDHSGRWYRVSAYSSRPGYVATIAHDISNRKRTEEALMESELKYRLLFENINDGVILVENDPGGSPGRIREANEVACRRLGYSREEMIGLSVSDIDPTFTGQERKEILARLKSGYSFERMHRAKDGTFIPVEICSKKVFLHGKEYVLTVNRDVTERIRSEKLLKLSYERMRRNHLFNELINTENLPRQTAQEMILAAGLNLPDVLTCYLVVIEVWQGKAQEYYWEQHPYELYLLKNSVVEVLEKDGSLVAWASPHGIGVLQAGDGTGGDDKARQEEVARTLREKVESSIPELSVKIGIAASTEGVTDVYGRYRQSRIAADTGRKVWPELAVYHYLDMGVFQLLPFIQDQTEVAAYVDRTLGPLLRYKKKADLLATLEAILENNNLTKAAKQLFIHQKTLEFRKRRIEQILGVSLENHEIRTALVIAVKLLKMDNRKNG